MPKVQYNKYDPLIKLILGIKSCSQHSASWRYSLHTHTKIKMYYCLKCCPRAVIHIHETSAECSPLTPWTALYKAEEITLGLRVHQELQLYSSDLSFNSSLTGSFGLASAPKYKNIWTFSQRGAVHEMGFIRDFVTAVDSELKWLSFFLSFSQLFTASLSWAFQQQAVPPKYQYRDPVTSDLLLCDQCPPGTAVKRHCTADTPTECHVCPERHFAENWHWGDTCQYCTSVCMSETSKSELISRPGIPLKFNIPSMFLSSLLSVLMPSP